jgi:uncharacterized protein
VEAVAPAVASPPTPPADARLGTPRRWAVFAVGAAALVTGIALAITAGLGVGSWQVLETGLVQATGAPFAAVAVAESVVALAVAWVLLGQRPWIATAVLAVGGVPIGLLLGVLQTPATAAGQAAMLAVSVPLLTVGVAFYLASDLGASAQDAVYVGLYTRRGLRPGPLRLAMDATLVAAGAALGGQVGVGTVVLTFGVPALIEPALRLSHRLAATPPPASLGPS